MDRGIGNGDPGAPRWSGTQSGGADPADADCLFCGPDDELLVAYCCDELSDSKRRKLERRLASEPTLAQRLERVRRCLAPCDEPSAGAPLGLAERTADRVLRPGSSADSGSNDAAVPICGHGLIATGWVDRAAFLAAVLAMLTMVGPALQSTREHSRRLACEENLRAVGQGLFAFADAHNGFFPPVAPDANAGVFALTLSDLGYLDRDELREWLLCPASGLADELAPYGGRLPMPTPDELAGAPLAQREALRRLMGGAYAYRIGYTDGGRYVQVRNRGSVWSPLLSDVARTRRDGVAFAHGSQGQNVLFDSGCLKFVVGVYSANGDHLFLNEAGRVAAGVSPGDVVLAPSEATPFGR